MSQGKQLLVVGPNLAIDHLIDARVLRPGQVQRVERQLLSAGGKGINVARASGCLKMEASVIGVLSGSTGQFFRTLLEGEPVRLEAVDAPGETRIATLIHDSASDETTVLNEVGSSLTIEVQDKLMALVKKLAPQAYAVALTGSLQPGLSDNIYGQTIAYLHDLEVPSLVDAKGAVLRQALRARPAVAKVNFDEAAALFDGGAAGDSKTPEQRAVQLAVELCRAGAATGIVTVGSLGAASATRHEQHFYYAPRVVARNGVGAGDTFLAAYATSMRSVETAAIACQFAIAAAAASVETSQPGHLHRARVDELLPHVRELL